jgi:hypothetical protein
MLNGASNTAPSLVILIANPIKSVGFNAMTIQGQYQILPSVKPFLNQQLSVPSNPCDVGSSIAGSAGR